MHQRSSTNPPTVFAHALSIKNVDRGVAQNKPNEDFAIVDRDNDIFIVADGVTRTASKTGYPTPSPASIAAATVGRAIHSALSEAIHSLPPTQALNFAAVKAN